ncbi:MAG TPA: ABC transporter permease [Syntrophaceticus sp.]|nr:ABC transporter permease [Syntrophaceticus sp.]
MSPLKRKEFLKIRVYSFVVLAVLLIVISLLAPYLAPNNPNTTNSAIMNIAPSAEYPCGTDRLGRCVCSRVIMGAQTSILSAIGLVAVSFLIGSVFGMLCGYYGGAIDNIIMRLADVLLAFPQMVLAIAVAGILGGGLLNALIALGITAWTLYARLARSHTMSIKNEPFIAAAKLSGCSDFTILFRHILPNIVGSLLVNATTQIGTTMIGIAGLSFLGLGVIPPNAEWGSMINEARSYIQLAPWTVLAPAIAMVVTIMIFNYLGDSVRDLADVSGVI